MIDRRAVMTVVALSCLGLAAGAAQARAQQRVPAGQTQVPPAGLSVVELQRWLDAYVSMQAQEALTLTDEQFPQFLARLRALQVVRRRHVQERNRILLQLGRMTAPNAARVDEANVRDALKALDTIDAKSAQDVTAAYQAIDGVLDLRQRARFRVFEDQMERRKLDLLARARRGAAMRRAPAR